MIVVKTKDMTGERYGRLTVVKHMGTKNKNAMWLCKCDCGNEVIVQRPSSQNLEERMSKMSFWCYVHGTVTVHPMGRTQAEKRYILETVLDHLPFVTGSESPMNVYIIQKNGYNSSSSHTEFGMWGGYRNWKTLSTETQDEYILVADGSLRDRMFDQTYREFQKWLCRLAKRVDVEDVLVEIKGWGESAIIRNPRVKSKYSKHSCDTVYGQMHEKPTWCYDDDEFGEPNWCEYLMWSRAKDSSLPMMLEYKYIANKENDEETERRIKYERGD